MEAVVRPSRPVEDLVRQTALQHVFDCISVGVAITVEDGKLIEVNNEFLTLIGIDREAALGVTLNTLLGTDLALSKEEHGAGGCDRTFTRSDGRHLWLRITTRQVTGRDQRVLLTVHSVEDITDHKTLEGALRERALMDPVTGLPNRYLLEDRLEHALARQARQGHELAVLFIDLDGFKKVNDTAGHRAGDIVLREAGRRIASCARACDTVARWAGDEFVVLIDTVSGLPDAEGVAHRIAAACEVPFHTDGLTFHLGASVGLSLTGTPPTHNADHLLDLADKAMYANKLSRR